jgi:hypothetical protein
MSKKPPVPKQHDLKFAKRVKGLIAGSNPQSCSLSDALSGALACAALSVLAKPDVQKKLVGRMVDLVRPYLDPTAHRTLALDLSLARTLLYHEEIEGETLEYLTVSEAARRLAVTPNTIYRWLGSSDYALAPVLEEPEFGPDRIAFEVFSRMKQEVTEAHEVDRLRIDLRATLPIYHMNLLAELNAQVKEDSMMTVSEILGLAAHFEIPVSRATVGRWPDKRHIPARRGRPPLAFSCQTVSEQLADVGRKIRRREIESASVQTLRRLKREQGKALRAFEVQSS